MRAARKRLTRSPRRCRTAAFMMAILVLFTGCEAYDLPVPRAVSEEDSYEVTVEFNDVLNLVPRSGVRVNDVTVGEVLRLVPNGWSADAVLRIRSDVDLPANAVAEVRQSSILGEKYVALEPPQFEEPVGQLEDGDRIPISRTDRTPEVEEVLGAVGFLLSGGGIGQLETIITEANLALSGNEDRGRSVLNRLSQLITTLDRQRTDVISTLESVNRLTGTLHRERGVVTKALDTLGPAIKVLSREHERLIDLLGTLDSFGKVSSRVVNEVGDQLLADLHHLEPILHALNKADRDLVGGLGMVLSFPFSYDSDLVVKGDYGNVRIRAIADLQNVLDLLGGTTGVDVGAIVEQLSEILDVPIGTINDLLSRPAGKARP